MRKIILRCLKKVLAITLALSVILPTQGIYAAEQESEILFAENFDGCITNTTDMGVRLNGEPNSRVIDEGNENKVLFLQNEAYNTVQASIGTTDADSIVFSMKVKFENEVVPFKATIKNATTSFMPIRITENGVVSHDGKKFGGVMKNVWTRFDIVYNSKLKRYSVYINGSCELYMYLYAELTGINNMTLEFEGREGSCVYLDDIAVYTGESPSGSIKGEEYNPESVEFVEQNAADEPVVFVNNDFNKAASVLGGIDAIGFEGEKWEYGEEENGNGYLFLDRFGKLSQSYFDAPIPADMSMKGVVFQADFSTKNRPPARVDLFKGRSGAYGWNVPLIIVEGEIRTSDGITITKVKKNKWVNVALVFDFRNRTYDVYCDGEIIVENKAFPNMNFDMITSSRTQVLPVAGTGTLMIDNLRMYESDVPKEFESADTQEAAVQKKDSFPNDAIYKSQLKDTVAVHLGSDWMFAKKDKVRMDAVPYVSKDRTMIPVRAVTEAFGLKVEWDESEKLITLDGKTLMKVGEKAMTINGKTVELDTAPEIKDGRTYIPIRALAEQVLGKKVFYCDYGLIVISDKEFQHTGDAELRRLSTYVFSERPSEEAIMQAFESSGYKNVHPRLHANADDFARFREESKTNPIIKEWTANVIKQADNILKQPPPKYEPIGGRILLISRAVFDRCANLGYAYQITGDKKYAERAWKEMESACSFPNWIPDTFLDCAEMAYGVALGYDWCYDYLTEEQRSFIEDSIVRLGLKEGIGQYNGEPKGINFVFQDMNWNVVCNGGLSAAALAIMDAQPAVSTYVLNRAFRSFEYMMTEFAPDGGWLEGPTYWGYTMQYFCIWMDCMKYTLGTYFNYPSYPGISKTADYVFALQGNEGANNFNDAGEGDCVTKEVLWFGRHFKNDGLTAAYLSYMDLRNKAGTIYDILYYDTSVTGSEINLPLDSVTRDVEFGAMRSNYDTIDGAYLSYRGGKTRVNHYNVGQGAFVFDALGVRWAMDVGGDPITYESHLVGARNSVYRIRAEGHNVIVINPSDDVGQDMDAFCPIIKSESKPRGAYQVLDLDSAYIGEATDYVRGYMLTDDRQTAVIRDEFNLVEKSEMYWFMHTRADIEIVSEDTAILTRNGKRMQFKMIVEGADAELKVMPAESLPTSPVFPGQTPNRGISKIAIHMNGKGKVSVSVRMTPLDSYLAENEFVCRKIDEWSIPDGEIGKAPTADKMWVDGEELMNFNPEQPYYTITLFSDEIPQITVDGGEYNTEYLSKAEDINGVTQIKVSDDMGRYTTYRISFKKLPTLKPIGDRNRLSPVNVYASANPQSDNMDYQAVDENLETRWSAENIQTLTCDFGRNVTVDGFGLAVMYGYERNYYFEIRVSEDGKDFTTVYDGATGGKTDKYEIFQLEPMKVRYVQYVGKKNNSNQWNSILEFAVFGQSE